MHQAKGGGFFFMDSVANALSSFFGNFTIRDVIDVVIIAIIIYQILALTRQTRAISVMKGLGVLIIAAWASEALRLQTLNWLLTYIINSGVIVMVVLFQPEIRRLLETIGQGKFIRHATQILSTSQQTQQDESYIGEELFDALVNMSRTRTGALIIVERDTALDAIMQSGTPVDARVTSELIENIFYPNTPLHDGAVVIRDGRIAAAACILPLTQRTDISQALGTRHRACIGMSENSDAYCFVVSEERGAISMAHDGMLYENYDSATLRRALGQLFGKPEQTVTLWDRLAARRRKGGARK
jgi:diadenylate cyclase